MTTLGNARMPSLRDKIEAEDQETKKKLEEIEKVKLEEEVKVKPEKTKKVLGNKGRRSR